MNYASVCDGIGAVHVAWKPLGWTCAWTSEIEPFPMAVVEHHFGYKNLGDMTKITEQQINEQGQLDLICGGTPCQAFSVAGLRNGLADPRGNLTLVYLRLVAMARPRWVVWENVPGVLSDKTGAFGAFLGGLGQLGYGFAYRILDAQWFGVAQRRRRVFVVGHLGDWRPAAQVLFEPEGVPRDSSPRREAGQGTAGTVIKGAAIGRKPEAGPQFGDTINDGSCYTLNCTEVHAVASSLRACGVGTERVGDTRGQDTLIPTVTPPLKAEGFDASEDGTGRGTPIVPIAFAWNNGGNTALGMSKTGCPPVRAGSSGMPAVAFQTRIARNGRGQPKDITDALTSSEGGTHADSKPHVAGPFGVRRLTPRECERLQGFPDNFSLIDFRGKTAADGLRYRALGNSMAVPCMAWIGNRIELATAHAGQRSRNDQAEQD